MTKNRLRLMLIYSFFPQDISQVCPVRDGWNSREGCSLTGLRGQRNWGLLEDLYIEEEILEMKVALKEKQPSNLHINLLTLWLTPELCLYREVSMNLVESQSWKAEKSEQSLLLCIARENRISSLNPDKLEGLVSILGFLSNP